MNPLIIPPDTLRKVLAKVKKDMNRNPRLKLPEDPNLNIWNYYTIMKITPVVMDDFLLILLTIPLTDQSLEMDLYKIYNLINQPNRSSEVECNQKMSISFFWSERGGRWGSSPSTSPANHQKLNIIQK